MALKSGVILQPGENLVMEIEAEMWAGNANPIAQAYAKLAKTIAKIFGYSQKGFLIITDQRVITAVTVVQCYCFTTDRLVKYVMPRSIKEVGYTKINNCVCCCPTLVMYYEGMTDRTSVQLKTGDEAEAVKIVDAFYAAIAKA
jgi:hypothetical protein